MFFVWYDDNPKKTVNDKIGDAVMRYKEKFGKSPSICKLNEKMQQPQPGSDEKQGSGVKVLTAKNIPQNYFWIGNEA